MNNDANVFENIHELIIYDPRLTVLKERAKYIDDSILHCATGKYYTPEFRFLKDNGGPNTTLVGYLKTITIEDDTSNSYFTRATDYSKYRVYINIDKKEFLEILQECIDNNIFLWQHKYFSFVLSDVIDRIIELLNRSTSHFFLRKGNKFIFSKGDGNILRNNKVIGKFTGLLIDTDSQYQVIIPRYDYLIAKPDNKTKFVYIDKENNLKFIINVGDAKIVKDTMNTNDFLQLVCKIQDLQIMPINFSKLVKFTSDDNEDELYREIVMPRTNFERRLVSIFKPKTLYKKKADLNIEKERITHRFSSLFNEE